MLDKAIQIATHAHKGQVDKGGHDYINHPLRVSQSMETEEQKIVAVLHDTVEDTDITLEYLKEEGFSDKIVEGVRCMTRNEGESWSKYIEKVKGNKIALRVKIGDLRDNLNLTRVHTLNDLNINSLNMYISTYHRLVKYERENK